MTSHASATASSAVATPVEQHLTFEIAGELYAIPILSVQEIRGWEPVARIPQTPPHVLGVIDLRGAVVPVVDLRTRLSIETRETTATTVVIVVRIEPPNAATVTLGCVVDAVSDVVNIEQDSIRPVPDSLGRARSAVLRGLSTVASRILLVLDPDRLVATDAAPDLVAAA
jgi:purine-binding chemotaxis protein CheW